MQNISEIFDHLKCKYQEDIIHNFIVRDDNNNEIAYLRPIIKNYLVTDPHLPELLSRWRRENPTISTGNLEITVERTIKWLNDLVIDRKDRLIFIITDLKLEPLGHIGYSNLDEATESIELDSVLRGVKNVLPGLMKHCTIKLIDWGYANLGVKDITLSVYSDNLSAVKFYEQLGFITTKKIPLVKIYMDNEEKYEVAKEGYEGLVQKFYLKMKYQK